MTVSQFDRGLLYGDGIFETVRVVRGVMPLWERHLARLRASAQLLDLPVPVDVAAQAAAAAAALGEGALRLTLTRGAGRRGYEPPTPSTPTLLLQPTAYTPPAGPWRAVIAQGVQVYSASVLWRIKSLSALEKVLARAEAARAGVEEALLLNENGALCEGAATNLFLVIQGEALTPPVGDGCLPGVAREVLLEHGAREATLTPADLARASEAFLTNALAGVIPLAAVAADWFQPEPITYRFDPESVTRRLQTAFAQALG